MGGCRGGGEVCAYTDEMIHIRYRAGCADQQPEGASEESEEDMIDLGN